jgi:acetyl/propionyl-CoA carboxylase alpha subunit
MISKLAVYGRTRGDAIDRMRRALDEYNVGGIKTTLPFFREVMRDAEFIDGKLDTGFISRFNDRKQQPEISETEKDVAMIAAALGYSNDRPGRVLANAETSSRTSRWAMAGRLSQLNGK